MRKHVRRLTGLTLFVMMLVLISSVGFAADKTITILQTSDIHGNIYPWSYKIGESDDDVGLAKVNSVVKKVKEENPNALLVDSGDIIQGTTLTNIFKDRKDVVNPMMKTMNYMEYDAMVLGNHEFNFGLPILERIMGQADFPVLSANTKYKSDGSDYMKPYVIKEVDGVKVGILGLTTPNIPLWDGPKVTSLSFQGMSESAEKYVPEMKEKGADIIIALAHAGLDGRHHKTGGDKARKVAENNPEISVIFSGHDHEKVNTTVNGVLVAAPEDKGHQVVRVDLKLNNDSGSWTVASKKADHYETYKFKADQGVLDVAEKYHEETVEYVNTPIGTATGDFTPGNKVKGIPAAQVQDTALVDLINKVQMEYTDADISAAALFTTDATIDKGPVSIKDAARIYKYSNTLYKVKISGKELKDYMEWSAAYYNTYKPGDVTISFNPEIRGYMYDMFAGVDFKIDISKPAGNRIKDLTYNGKPVKDDQIFTLALNNYRYSGLKSSGIISREPMFKSDKGIREYIIDYIRERDVINPTVDNNWEIVGADLDHWAKAEALKLMNDGVLTIPSENRSWNGASLNLREDLRRKTVVRSIVNLFNYNLPSEVEEMPYSDLNEDLARYVKAIEDYGLDLARSENSFGPEDKISRQQAVDMVFAGMRVETESADLALLNKYDDKEQIKDNLTDEMAKAVEMGLISGRPGNELDPRDEMRMGEFASFLNNLIAKYKRIDFLSVNDFHGKLKAGYEAGAAKLAAFVNHYKSQNPEGSIFLSGGDDYQGTPISGLNNGKPVVEVYNYLELTAQAVGNHEFDWGVETLKEIKNEADHSFLAANLYNKNTGKQVEWAEPYMMKNVNGLEVGIIGISTPETRTSTMPSNIADLEFRDPAPVINDLAKKLRNKGADMVIVVSHMPGTADYDTGELKGELIDTARLTKVTGIIGGHSHHTVTGIINGTPVVEAYKHGRELGNLRYFVRNSNEKIYKARPMSHPVRSSNMAIKPDETVQAIVDKYQKELEPIMSEVLIEIDKPLERSYDRISNIGNLITDSMVKSSEADIAFQNPGGIRIDLPAGKLTVGDWYEVLPFGNTIVTGEMTGAQIIEVLEQSFTLDKGMMQMAGLEVKYDSSKPEYDRVVEVRLANGEKLQKDKTYLVATNNFLAEGGDKYSTFKEVEFTNTYKKVRSAVMEYLRKQDTISPNSGGRTDDINKQAAIIGEKKAA